MPPPTHSGCLSFLVPLLLLPTTIGACDRTQAVSLTAEDFRFTPELVRIGSASPLTLTVYNAGREIHEFDSPILTYAVNFPSSNRTVKPASAGIILEPGQSFRLILAPAPGTYLYVCRRKGHANMTGTMLVE
jgi:plastocyanin